MMLDQSQQLNYVFSNGSESRAVRVILHNGEPWWVLADVCSALGLSNPTVVAQRLEPEDVLAHTLSSTEGNRGNPTVRIVSEAGLYQVILGARANEKTKVFKRWVTNEVLPSIRRTGAYSVQPGLHKLTDDPLTLALRAALEAREQLQQLETRTGALEQRLQDEPLRSSEINQVYKLGKKLGLLMGGYDKAWRLFKDRFGLASYRDLPRRELENGLRFLEQQIAAWSGRDQHALVQP
jgi:prophage antirepressor-like protein